MPVTNEKERIKLSCSRVLPTYSGRTGCEKLEKMPHTDDTAENRHCVQTDLDHGKDMPGFSCIFRTRWAFILPSSPAV